jgi:endo-1,4-beta-xylanase
MFDLSNPDAPIPQFVSAMKLAGIELSGQQIVDAFNNANNFQIKNDASGKHYTEFAYTIDRNGASYSMGFTYDEKGGWQETTLRELAAIDNIEIGTLITKLDSIPDLSDEELERLNSSQFNLGLISLYWPGMEEQQNIIDASSRIDAANFGTQNSMDTIGYLLIWGKDIPTWLRTGNFSRDEIIKIMQARIKNTIELMAKQGVYSFAIVNEAGSGDDYFMKEIGKDYIDIAFQAARDTGKELGVPLTLIYNDYSNDTPSGSRTEITQEIVNDLKGKGLIDAIGLEMIVSYPENPSEAEMIQTMQAYGLPVIITEAAVNMGNFNGDATEKSIAQSQIYQNIFGAAIKSGVCSKIIVFTSIDEISPWVTETTLDGYSLNNAPSLFYLNNRIITTKPAYYAVLQALMEK